MAGHVTRGGDPGAGDAADCLGDHILDHSCQKAPDKLVGAADRLYVRRFPVHLAHHGVDEGNLAERLGGQKAGAQPIIDIVGVIGDVVGEGGDLRLEAGLRGKVEVAEIGIGAEGRAGARRPVVFHEPFKAFVREVQPVIVGVTALEPGHDAVGLKVVIEPAVLGHQPIEHAFPLVAERRVPEVVGQGERFGQILVEGQNARDGARDLRNLEAVREPAAIMVPVGCDEDLCLVREAAKRGGVDDAVPVPLERGACRRGWLGNAPAPRVVGVSGVGRKQARGGSGWEQGSPPWARVGKARRLTIPQRQGA